MPHTEDHSRNSSRGSSGRGKYSKNSSRGNSSRARDRDLSRSASPTCSRNHKSKILSSLKVKHRESPTDKMLQVKNVIDKNSLYKIENYFKERGII